MGTRAWSAISDRGVVRRRVSACWFRAVWSSRLSPLAWSAERSAAAPTPLSVSARSRRRRRWSLVGLGVLGMARITGWHEGPLAPAALDQGPAVVGLEVVVVTAVAVESVEGGAVRLGPVLTVV